MLPVPPKQLASVPRGLAIGFCWKVITTSSVEAVQGGLLIVQRNLYLAPRTPPDLGGRLVPLPKLPPAWQAAPSSENCSLRVPPVAVAEMMPQTPKQVGSVPTGVAIGFCWKVITTSSVEAVQGG